MKVTALTSGHNTPSARFRVRQYLPRLKSLGIDVTDYCPAVSNSAQLPGPLRKIRRRYLPPIMVAQSLLNIALRVPGVSGSLRGDVTWLERNFAPGLDDLAFVLKRPLVVDIDDAIWLYNPFGAGMIRRLVSRADAVFAGNQYLADWCRPFCRDIHVIPTAIDTERFRPVAAPREHGDRFVVGWTGTAGNFRFLRNIEPPLAAFLRKNSDATFLVVADERPSLPSLPQEQLQFVRWTASIEHEILAGMDVGIMPIDDSDLSRGKCSFKMLQYMAAGIPVVVSPYGMNAELLALDRIGVGAVSSDDWVDALQLLHGDQALRERLGAAGRAVAETDFSTASVANKIAKAFGAM
ncbi:glycosyltransferase family 4 protein [Trinickia dinghuensis]|uniref:Glycosyltransferase n=1 Tax=Trinickia dinghuensis TaxID=2291023 RepID=A0A3D8JTJ1_9BURK|nr:glycosyltransferase family 4 protein [Trinickia dinghuensis]RDU96035.1 glycosyltransferase [Trinickia dinghuensis]